MAGLEGLLAGRELEETIRIDPRRDIAHANIGEVRWARCDREGHRRLPELNTDPRRERIATAKLHRMAPCPDAEAEPPRFVRS